MENESTEVLKTIIQLFLYVLRKCSKSYCYVVFNLSCVNTGESSMQALAPKLEVPEQQQKEGIFYSRLFYRRKYKLAI